MHETALNDGKAVRVALVKVINKEMLNDNPVKLVFGWRDVQTAPVLCENYFARVPIR